MDTTAARSLLLEAKKAGSGTAAALLDESPRLAHAEYGEVERKAAGATGIVATDDETGLVEAIVSVTGIVDEVDDVIMPGAYKTTLATRTPKGVWSHDWDHWVARTEEVEELLPGDPRLPSKTRAGAQWPKEAGALLVKARFNLGTQAGKDAYSNVVFFADECEWSIGYNVQQGKSSRDAMGRRLIKQIDLFEYSPVLFGAMPLASTLAVKGREVALEHKSGSAAAAVLLGNRMTEAINGDTVDDVDALAVLDLDAVEVDPDDVALIALLDSDDDAAEEKGSSASLNRSPKSNWVEESGDLPKYIREIARSIEKTGKTLSQAIAIAVSRVKKWAAGGDNVKPDTVAKAQAALAEWEALKAKNRARMSKPGKKAHEDHVHVSTASGYNPVVETGATAGTKRAERAVEIKAYPHVSGSHEERRAALSDALNERFAPKGKGGSDKQVEMYVETVGTFDDHVVIRVHDWSNSSGSEDETWWVDYSWDSGGQVVLGEPRTVSVDITVDVHNPAQTEDPYVENVEGEFVGAAAKALALVAECKAGRVLSTSNAERLRQAYEHLGAVLAAAGVEVGPAVRDQGPSMDTSPDTTAPSVVGPVAVKTAEDENTATIDMADLLQAKSLSAFLDSV